MGAAAGELPLHVWKGVGSGEEHLGAEHHERGEGGFGGSAGNLLSTIMEGEAVMWQVAN